MRTPLAARLSIVGCTLLALAWSLSGDAALAWNDLTSVGRSMLDGKEALRRDAPVPVASGSCFGAQSTRSEVAERAAQAAVLLRFPGREDVPLGSGFLVAGASPGLVVTAAHVIVGPLGLEAVSHDGRTLGLLRPRTVSLEHDMAVMEFLESTASPPAGLRISARPGSRHAVSRSTADSVGPDVLMSGSAFVDGGSGLAEGVLVSGSPSRSRTTVRVGHVGETAAAGRHAVSDVSLPHGGIFRVQGFPPDILESLRSGGADVGQEVPPPADGSPVGGLIAGYPGMGCVIVSARGRWTAAVR